jgi:hypothetical protein
MILRRDVVVSLAPGARVQPVASPGAPWTTTSAPVLATNMIDETLLPAAGAWRSPRGLYVRLVSPVGDLPGGAEVYVDPESRVVLVEKLATSAGARGRNAGVALGFGIGLLVAAIVGTALV